MQHQWMFLPNISICSLYNEVSKEYYKQDNIAEYAEFASSPPQQFEDLVDAKGNRIAEVKVEPKQVGEKKVWLSGLSWVVVFLCLFRNFKLLDEEKKILNTLRFDVLVPTVFWYVAATHLPSTQPATCLLSSIAFYRICIAGLLGRMFLLPSSSI